MFNSKSDIKPINIELVDVSLDQLHQTYCIYEIWQRDNLVYLGTCRLAMVTLLPDANTIAAYRDLVRRIDPVSIRVIALGTRRDCLNHRGALLRALPAVPDVNRHQKATRGQVQCVQDGKIYNTQHAAAEAYGISQGNLSNH